MFLKQFITLSIVTVLMTLTATGQAPSPTSQSPGTNEVKKDDAQKSVKANALELLDVVMKDIQRLKVAQNRLYLSTTSGDLLWKHDEPAARALFKDAIADLHAILNEQLETKGQRSHQQSAERGVLREKVLFTLAKYDSRMALDLLAETRPKLAPCDQLIGPGESSTDSEVELETRLAAVIAENDPKHALEMARKSLAKGFSNNLTNLLSVVHKKDSAAAAELASDILAKLKTANLVTDQQASNVAIKIIEMASELPKPKAKSTSNDAIPLFTDQSVRELAELMVTSALEAISENPSRYLYSTGVLKQLEKYAPSRVPQLQRKYAQAGFDAYSELEYHDYRKAFEGTTEEILAAAEKADPSMRSTYYSQAAFKAGEADKIDQARQIISTHITDPEQRRMMLAQLDEKLLADAAAKGKLEETRKLISTVASNEERIGILTQLATAIAEKGEKKVALQILEEALTFSSNRPRYSRQLFARFQIARAYISINAAQSLAMLDPMIDQLNELIGAGILIGEFVGEDEVVRDDELLIAFVGQLTDSLQQQYGKDLALLATVDFAGTRNAAERFQRFEVQLMARLLVVQCVLKKEAEKPGDSLKPTVDSKQILVSP